MFIDEYLYRRFIHVLCRYTLKENKLAAKELDKLFDPNIMGVMMKFIYLLHRDKDTLYELSPEAEEVYEEICEKYNDQFNLKWSGMKVLYPVKVKKLVE